MSFRRLRYLPQLLVLLLALTTLPAMAATTLACGTYLAPDGGDWIVIENSRQAVRRGEDQPPVHYLIRQQGAELHVANLSDGETRTYTVDADSTRISTPVRDYVLDNPAQCSTPPAPVANSCRADIDTCIEAARTATPVQLKQLCQQDLPFACRWLVNAYKEQAQEQQRGGVDALDFVEPEFCKEQSPQYDEDTCREVALEHLKTSLGNVTSQLLPRDEQPLADGALDALLQLCKQHPDAGFCEAVAEVHWTATRFVSAGLALKVACENEGSHQTCQKAQAIQALRPAQLDTSGSTRLPCGDYLATSNALLGDLSFGDHGTVSQMKGPRMAARLEHGNVHIRHDKGGDFVLKHLTNGDLLGLDSWNRLTVYERTGGAGSCAAPISYNELPLPQDCPVGEDPEACCNSGKLLGCNVMGHRNALAGDWQAAAPYYLKLCQAGVRAGCENLLSVYQRTGDEDIPATLQAACQRDGEGTHVACDAYRLSN